MLNTDLNAVNGLGKRSSESVLLETLGTVGGTWGLRIVQRMSWHYNACTQCACVYLCVCVCVCVRTIILILIDQAYHTCRTHQCTQSRRPSTTLLPKHLMAYYNLRLRHHLNAFNKLQRYRFVLYSTRFAKHVVVKLSPTFVSILIEK